MLAHLKTRSFAAVGTFAESFRFFNLTFVRAGNYCKTRACLHSCFSASEWEFSFWQKTVFSLLKSRLALWSDLDSLQVCILWSSLQICEIETNEAFQQNYSNQQSLWKYEVPYSCSSKSQPKKGPTSKRSLTNGTKCICHSMIFCFEFWYLRKRQSN